MEEKLKRFWFLESIGVLAWVYMYVVWNLDIRLTMFMIVPFAVLAILFSIVSLVYATIGLDRKSVPLIAVVPGNLWVAADSFWAVYDFTDLDGNGLGAFMAISHIFTVLLGVLATWEFVVSKDNKETFAKFFGKFKSG